MSELRDIVGVVLRFPVVAVLAILWVFTIWPISVIFGLIFLIGKPIIFPLAYVWYWLLGAFMGQKDAVLPDYWEKYPDEALEAFTLGFPTLRSWLLKGWS